MGWRSYRGWEPYVPVAQRRRQGEAKAKKQLKKGETLQPIKITGRKMATTFWGNGWCEHLERYSDFANRLPRGRTYARNGSILDFRISQGKIKALVAGSDLYKIEITIDKLPAKQWQAICGDCSHSIHSIIDLMRGKLSLEVLSRLSDRDNGMFPKPKEIRLSCNCPDDARLCKHLAAVLYGVGHRLDTSPELLFLLRHVDQTELVSESISSDRVNEELGLNTQTGFESDDLGEIFGIDLVASAPKSTLSKPTQRKAQKRKTKAKKATRKKPARKKPTGKKPATKKPATKKPATKKPATKKPATRKSAAKKPATKKPAAKKPATKKPAAKKSATRKSAAKKPATKKSAAKKSAAKKSAAKKPAAKKSATRKSAAKKPATKKSATRKKLLYDK